MFEQVVYLDHQRRKSLPRQRLAASNRHILLRRGALFHCLQAQCGRFALPHAPGCRCRRSWRGRRFFGAPVLSGSSSPSSRHIASVRKLVRLSARRAGRTSSRAAPAPFPLSISSRDSITRRSRLDRHQQVRQRAIDFTRLSRTRGSACRNRGRIVEVHFDFGQRVDCLHQFFVTRSPHSTRRSPSPCAGLFRTISFSAWRRQSRTLRAEDLLSASTLAAELEVLI